MHSQLAKELDVEQPFAFKNVMSVTRPKLEQLIATSVEWSCVRLLAEERAGA